MIKLILKTIKDIEQSGFEAYLVGGSVRDLILGQAIHDLDFTTDARPEELLRIFPTAKYENDFGTVIYPIKDRHQAVLAVLEITTYRRESGYRDHRRPDQIIFEKDLTEDLKRRDFTINALALRPVGKKAGQYGAEILAVGQIPLLGSGQWELLDLFGGLGDIKNKIIRAVGEPLDRFKEDALRMMRAVRFSAQLGFSLEAKTERAIVKMAGSLKFVAKERIKDELIKILASNNPAGGIEKMYRTKLLQYIIPELLVGVAWKQNHHHIYSVFKHNLLSLKYCPSSKWQVRLAALLHDVGKPKSSKIIQGQTTFHNHEYIGARMTEKIMTRLKFSRADIDLVVNLVKNHMFYYQVGEVTATSVRRLIAKTGQDNLKDLIDLRIADRLGSGTPKAKPYKLRHLQYMMEKVQNDPISVKMLKINGDLMIKKLKMKPGPKMGAILDVLLAEVIDRPELNEARHLLRRTEELDQLDLSELRNQAQTVIEGKREEEDESIKKKFKV